jgi:hypothetical protein
MKARRMVAFNYLFSVKQSRRLVEVSANLPLTGFQWILHSKTLKVGVKVTPTQAAEILDLSPGSTPFGFNVLILVEQVTVFSLREEWNVSDIENSFARPKRD